jgi:hypothetical protein
MSFVRQSEKMLALTEHKKQSSNKTISDFDEKIVMPKVYFDKIRLKNQ